MLHGNSHTDLYNDQVSKHVTISVSYMRVIPHPKIQFPPKNLQNKLVKVVLIVPINQLAQYKIIINKILYYMYIQYTSI